MPLPTGFPYPDFPSSSVTAEGVETQFWVNPDSLRERFVADAPSTARAKVYCHGSDAPDLVKGMLGYTLDTGSGSYTRVPPFQHPLFATLYAYEMVLDESGNETDEIDGWPDHAWHGYTVNFRDRPYLIDGPDGSATDLQKYISLAFIPHGRERKVPDYGVDTDETPPVQLPSVGFIVDRTEDLTITQYDVPAALYPYAAAAAAIGGVNDTAITLGTPTGPRTFPEETLFYRGVAEEITPHRLRNGVLAYSPSHLFSFRPLGWNKFKKADGTVVGLRIRGTTNKLYEPLDLTAIFLPVAP